jgi:hypothetical protein
MTQYDAPADVTNDADAAPPPPERRGESETEATPPVPPPGPHEAKAGSYFRNVRYVIAAALIGMGCWFLYDGFVTYPADNVKAEKLQDDLARAGLAGDEEERARLADEVADAKTHSDADILLQRVLGFALPPIGIILLVRWLHMSRGRVRLDADDVLHAPGHPPVPASAVTEIDDRGWDRKGISLVRYEVDKTPGVVKLDDFVYDRAPIDAIHDRLVHLKSTSLAGDGGRGFPVEPS